MLSATPKRLFKLERREDLLGPKADALIAEERHSIVDGAVQENEGNRL